MNMELFLPALAVVAVGAAIGIAVLGRQRLSADDEDDDAGGRPR